MAFFEYSNNISDIGRGINTESVIKTRKLIAPLLELAPFLDINVSRNIKYGVDNRHKLDIFTAKEQLDSSLYSERPLLIFVHGGGFVAGDKSTLFSPFYDNVGVWAVRNGFDAVNITYRLAPEHKWPAGPEDIHAAIQFIEKNADEYGISAKNIYLMGQSAGAAHVAGYLADSSLYSPIEEGLSGAILLSGLYDFTSMQVSDLERAYLGEDKSVYKLRSSLTGVLETDVPLLVCVAEHDPDFFQSQGLELLSALQIKHNKLPHVVYAAGQNHFSVILYLGLEGDLLAPQLKHFIRTTYGST